MAFNDLCAGYISYCEYRRYVNNADIHFIKDSGDPAPYKIYRKSLKRVAIKDIIKRVIKWKK